MCRQVRSEPPVGRLLPGHVRPGVPASVRAAERGAGLHQLLWTHAAAQVRERSRIHERFAVQIYRVSYSGAQAWFDVHLFVLQQIVENCACFSSTCLSWFLSSTIVVLLLRCVRLSACVIAGPISTWTGWR